MNPPNRIIGIMMSGARALAVAISLNIHPISIPIEVAQVVSNIRAKVKMSTLSSSVVNPIAQYMMRV